MAEDKKVSLSELEQLELDEKRLRVEDLRMRVEQEKTRREFLAQRHRQQQEQLDAAAREERIRQDSCRHKKGGKGLEGFLSGNAQYYCVVKHTYPWGELVVMCTRCGKEWRKPPSEMRKTNRQLYEKLLREYQAAVNFETDNEPSGSPIFTFTKDGAPVEVVSMSAAGE